MIATSPTVSAKRLIRGTIFAHIDFVVTGVVMTFLGPMLPVLSARWALNDTQSGDLFLAQYISSIGGMLCSGTFVRRLGYRLTLIIGATLMAVGTALLVGAGRYLGIASICIYGAGFGVTTPACNLFVSDAMPEKRASALSLLNSSWGVGAMSCPLIIAAVQRVHQTTAFFYALAACMAVLALTLCLFRFAADEKRHTELSRKTSARTWNTTLTVFVGLAFFIYVGTETAVGGWVATYAQRISPGSVSMWAMMPTFFYGTVLLGRMLAPAALRTTRETRLAAAGAGLAVIGVIVLMGSHTMAMIILGTSLSGFGLSAIYPIKVSLLPRWFGDRVTQVGGFMFAIGNLGGGAIPWLVGALSTRFSDLRAGFVVPLLGAVSLVAFYSAQRRLPASSLRQA
jgi:MFS transporter, FHS family, glucose/mannose:H+ symporter